MIISQIKSNITKLLKIFLNDEERLEYLFRLYEEMIEKENKGLK